MDMVQRVQDILLRPKDAWRAIDGEATTTEALYKGYIVPLAAIGPVATFIGSSVIGIGLPFGRYRVPLGTAVVNAVVSYAMALAGAYILALIIDALASTFSGQGGKVQALKVAAYAPTPAWLAGILFLVPTLGILALLAGLYSLYLLYLGLPVLMKSPPEKSLGYTVVVVVAAIVIFAVIGVVTRALLPYPSMFAPR
jgi:Yip1-like protein